MDTALALEAADTWRTLAKLIPTIRAHLEPMPSQGANVRMPPASRPPINLAASDLLFELDEAANWYAVELTMETADVKRVPTTLEAVIELIAERHGHWTADPNERIGKEYADIANQFLDRTRRLVMKPPPPRFVGRCLTACGGDLWLTPGKHNAACDNCGSTADLASVREQLARAFASRLMTRAELGPALKLLGGHVPRATIDSWINRGRLVPVIRDPQMFRFIDAVDLAKIDIAA